MLTTKQDYNSFYGSLAKLFITFPSRAPKGTQAEQDAVYKMWEKAFQHLDCKQFDEIVDRFVLEHTKLFPDDNLLALLREKSILPMLLETAGDCIELAFAVVGQPGCGRYGSEGTARAWLEERSPLCASVIMDKIGYSEFLNCTNQDFIRSQVAKIFNEEKDRALRLGYISGKAKDFKNGLPMMDKVKALATRSCKLLR